MDHVAYPQANAVINEVTGQSLKYPVLSTGPDKAIWIKALANGLGRLAQGIGPPMPKGINTFALIKHHAAPTGGQVPYGRIVASIRPNKDKMPRIRVTEGGD